MSAWVEAVNRQTRDEFAVRVLKAADKRASARQAAAGLASGYRAPAGSHTRRSTSCRLATRTTARFARRWISGLHRRDDRGREGHYAQQDGRASRRSALSEWLGGKGWSCKKVHTCTGAGPSRHPEAPPGRWVARPLENHHHLHAAAVRHDRAPSPTAVR